MEIPSEVVLPQLIVTNPVKLDSTWLAQDPNRFDPQWADEFKPSSITGYKARPAYVPIENSDIKTWAEFLGFLKDNPNARYERRGNNWFAIVDDVIEVEF